MLAGSAVRRELPVFAAVTRDTLRALEVAPDAPVADIIVPVEEVAQAP